MFRVLMNGILATANTFLNRDSNVTTDHSSTSKWRTVSNFIFSTISIFRIPFLRTFTENETIYEIVNTLLANSTTNRNNMDNRQRRNSNINRLSRPNFRRRLHHSNNVVRILKPTINIHIH